jgi:hypothetical protein
MEGTRIVFNRDSDKVICENARLWVVPGSNSFDKVLKP